MTRECRSDQLLKGAVCEHAGGEELETTAQSSRFCVPQARTKPSNVHLVLHVHVHVKNTPVCPTPFSPRGSLVENILQSVCAELAGSPHICLGFQGSLGSLGSPGTLGFPFSPGFLCFFCLLWVLHGLSILQDMWVLLFLLGLLVLWVLQGLWALRGL